MTSYQINNISPAVAEKIIDKISRALQLPYHMVYRAFHSIVIVTKFWVPLRVLEEATIIYLKNPHFDPAACVFYALEDGFFNSSSSSSSSSSST